MANSLLNVFLVILCSSTTTAKLCSSTTTAKLCQTAATRTSIFILAGQSNMVGQGGVDMNNRWDGVIPPLCKPNQKRILRLNNDLSWEVAKEPLHQGITGSNSITCGVGPGMPFANSLLSNSSSSYNRSSNHGVLGLVPCASSGTAISQWARGTFLYNNMIARARAAVNNSVDGHIRGLLWYQGESDTGPTATSYKQRLEELFNNVRSDLMLPQLPIIQVALAAQYGYNTGMVRNVQLGTRLPNVKCVDAWGLNAIPPTNIHLTTDSQVKLGIMIADSFIDSFN